MAYEGKCGSCGNFEEPKGKQLYSTSNPYYKKGYCNWYKVYYYPDDSCPKHYRSRSSSGNNCYITTIVCNVLGKEDDCEELNTLRQFRGEVLQKDEQYKDILFEYDTVGPKIAFELSKEDKEVVEKIYRGFIKPIVSLVKEKKYDEAIIKYTTLTKSLEDYYGIEYNHNIPQNYDYKNGGHGKKLVLE